MGGRKQAVKHASFTGGFEPPDYITVYKGIDKSLVNNTLILPMASKSVGIHLSLLPTCRRRVYEGIRVRL